MPQYNKKKICIWKVCDSIATISTNTFGNRATRTLVGGCCHDNLCNTHIKKISTTTTSTTTTTTTTTPTTTHNCKISLQKI